MGYDPATYQEETLFQKGGLIGYLAGVRKRRIIEYAMAGLDVCSSDADRPRRILDIGCGYGDVTAGLVADNLIVVGADINPTAITVASETVPHASFVVTDITALPFPDGAFDAVVCSDVLEHLAVPRELATEIVRVTRPGGVYSLSVPNEWVTTLGRIVRGMSPWKAPAHLQSFSISSFLGLFPDSPERQTVVPFGWLPFRLSTQVIALFRRTEE